MKQGLHFLLQSLLICGILTTSSFGQHLQAQSYCTPAYTGGVGANPFFTHILEVHLEEISHVHNNAPGNAYEDNTNLEATVVRGDYYHIRVRLGNGANTQTVAVWLDSDRNKHFSSDELLFYVTDQANSGEHTIDTTIQIPENAQTGETRLRVGTIMDTSPADPCINSGFLHQYQHFQDYTVNIIEPEAQVIESVTAFRPNEKEVVAGTDDNEILGIKVITNKGGVKSPFLTDAFSFSFQGLTDLDDVERAKVYFTGRKPFFDTNNQSGEVLQPGFNFDIPSVEVLRGGTNYFWLALDVSSDAQLGNKLNSALQKVAIDNMHFLPEEGFPEGERRVGYCSTEGIQNIFVYVDRVFLDSIDNTSGQDINGYGDYTDHSTTLYRDSTYQASFFIGNGANQAHIKSWIDFYRTGSFDDATDLVLDEFWPAGTGADPDTTPVEEQIHIPHDAELGPTRMRVSAKYNQPSGPCDMPIQTGEAEDYTIIIAEPGYPLADFEFDEACTGDSVQFNNKTSIYGNADIDSYDWDFGDGNSSQDTNPVHVYNSPGLYEVTLTATSNASGSPQHAVSKYIYVSDPRADFVHTNAAAGETVTFSCVVDSARISSCNWTFNDPYTSNNNAVGTVVQHTFDSAGTYDVELVAQATGGCTDTVSRNVNVTEYLPPVANYNTASYIVYRETPVQLKDLSLNNPQQWLWSASPSSVSFADNTDSSSQNPAIVFQQTGPYEVQLIAENDAGKDTISKQFNVQDYSPPVAQFSASPVEVLAGEQVTFTDESSNSPVSWNWDFGDGNTAEEQHPVHHYTSAGTYTVELTVANPADTNTTTQHNLIEVSDAYRMCNFAVTSSPLDTGHLYDSGGPTEDYMNNSDCGFLIKPECAGPITLNFHFINMNQGDYIQVFDGEDTDGEPLHPGNGFTGSHSSVSVTANSGAMYIREVDNTFTNFSGFHATWYTEKNHPPEVSFTGDTEGYINSPLYFENTSVQGVGDTYIWDFTSDGEADATGHKASYAYADTGDHVVSLTGTNCAGTDQASQIIRIDTPAQIPEPDFYAERDTVDFLRSVRLFDASLHGPVSWEWNLHTPQIFYQEGTDENSQNPVFALLEPGFYDVTLTASNHLGSSTPLTRENYILVRAEEEMCDQPFETEFVAGRLTDDGGEDDTYSHGINCTYFIKPPCAESVGLIFDFFEFESGDYLRIYDDEDTTTANALHPGSGFTDNTPPPDTLFSSSGKLYIKMITDNDENSVGQGFAADWFTILKDTVNASFTAPDTINQGETVTFDNHSEGSVDAFKWDLNGDGQIDDTAKAPSYQYTQPGDYQVSLTTEGCIRDDEYVHDLHVRDIEGPPQTDFKAHHTRINLGSEVYFTDLTERYPWSWNWTFDPDNVVYTQGTDANSQHPVVEFTDTGYYEVSLRTTNFLGHNTETKPAYIHVFSYCIPQVTNPDTISEPRFIIDEDTLNLTLTDTGYTPPGGDTLMLEKGKLYHYLMDAQQGSFKNKSGKIWMDYNQDGSFDDSLALLEDDPDMYQEYRAGTFRIPSEALEGPARMRIATFHEQDNSISSCDTINNGWVKDIHVYVMPEDESSEILLNGSPLTESNVCTYYDDAGAEALSPEGNIISHHVSVSGTVDTAARGTYVKTYSLPDSLYPNASIARRLVFMVAGHRPDLTLKGSDTVRMQVFNTYEDSGAMAMDFCDGDISDQVQLLNAPDTARTGIYNVNYVVQNSFGNYSDTVTRQVEVFDTIPPEIVLFDSDTMYVTLGTPFTDPGAVAIDHYFGFLPVDVTGTVNTDSPGVYTIHYNAADPFGNQAEEQIRYVIVEPGMDIMKDEGSISVTFLPNPARDRIYPEVNHPYQGGIDVTIYDMQGRKQASGRYDMSGEGEAGIAVDHLSPGSYWIRWEFEGHHGMKQQIIID